MKLTRFDDTLFILVTPNNIDSTLFFYHKIETQEPQEFSNELCNFNDAKLKKDNESGG